MQKVLCIYYCTYIHVYKMHAHVEDEACIGTGWHWGGTGMVLDCTGLVLEYCWWGAGVLEQSYSSPGIVLEK